MTLEEEVGISASSVAAGRSSSVSATVGIDVGDIATLVDYVPTVRITGVSADRVSSIAKEAAVSALGITAGRFATIATNVCKRGVRLRDNEDKVMYALEPSLMITPRPLPSLRTEPPLTLPEFPVCAFPPLPKGKKLRAERSAGGAGAGAASEVLAVAARRTKAKNWVRIMKKVA